MSQMCQFSLREPEPPLALGGVKRYQSSISLSLWDSSIADWRLLRSISGAVEECVCIKALASDAFPGALMCIPSFNFASD